MSTNLAELRAAWDAATARVQMHSIGNSLGENGARNLNNYREAQFDEARAQRAYFEAKAMLKTTPRDAIVGGQ